MMNALRTALLAAFLAMLALAGGAAPAGAQSEVRALCGTDEGRRELMNRMLAEKPAGTFTDADYQIMGTGLQEMCGGVVARWERAYDVWLCPPPAPFTAWCMKSRECNVDWNEECEYTGDAEIPAELKLQVCRLEYRVAGTRGDDIGFRVEPRFPIGDQENRTNRFRGYYIRLWAKGPYKIFNQTGAKMRVEGVRLLALPLGTDDARRRELGCEFFNHPVVQPPRPVPPAKPPQRNEVTKLPGPTSEDYRIIMRNPGTVANRTLIRMWVYDPLFSREILKLGTTVDLLPGAIWDREFHHSGGTVWRFESALLSD